MSKPSPFGDPSTHRNWKTILADHESSGLSVKKFCEQNNINLGYFYERRAAHKKSANRKSTRESCDIIRIIEEEYRPRSFGGKTLKFLPHQRRIANEMFRLEDVPGKPGQQRFKYTTMVWSCPKKSGKTEIAGAVTYAFARLFGGEMYSIANDLEGAKNRMFDRVEQSLIMLREHDRERFDQVVLTNSRGGVATRGQIEFADDNQRNHGPHTLRYIASDYAGEAGAMNSLVVFDELWAVSSERGERLWTEMQPIPNLAASIRFVTTYAGFYGESGLLWRLYENVVKPDPHTNEEHGRRIEGLEDLPIYLSDDNSTIVYWDHEARMPWHTEEALNRAQTDPSMVGRESEYRRLWHNEWSSGVEAFIEMGVVDRAIARGEMAGLENNLSQIMRGVEAGAGALV